MKAEHHKRSLGESLQPIESTASSVWIQNHRKSFSCSLPFEWEQLKEYFKVVLLRTRTTGIVLNMKEKNAISLKCWAWTESKSERKRCWGESKQTPTASQWWKRIHYRIWIVLSTEKQYCSLQYADEAGIRPQCLQMDNNRFVFLSFPSDGSSEDIHEMTYSTLQMGYMSLLIFKF